MSSTGTKEVPTENNNKSEKRKSRLRPITPIELPQKTRIVKFKQSGKIESLPIDYELNVKFLPKQITYDNCKDFEISENKNGKIKNKSKLIKKPKLSTFQIYPISNVKLPEPKFKILKQKGKDYREPCEASFAYYRYLEHNENNDDNEESDVEYDMDEEDSIWLDKMNKKRKSERLIDVDDDTFEMLMDRLEKESFFQSQYNGKDAPAIDEDAVCCICYDGECQNSNAILFCDMCNLAVHQECYGVPYIPEGQWLCRRCMQSPSRAVDCALCPNKDGAFKQTDDNRWAHVICALWIPEVCFANTVFLEPIDSIGAIPHARWKLNCVVCLKKEGACIQCHKSNCYTAFHVTCAQRTGLYMKIEAVKESSSQGMSIRKTAYCSLHAPSKNGNSNGLYSSGDEDGKTESRKTKKVLELSGKKGPELLLPIVSIPTIPIDRLQRISETVLFPRRNEFLVRLYAYWKLKRQSRNGAPLLRKLQNSNSLMRLDLKEKSKRDHNKFQSQYQKIYQIRCDLEKVRLLLEQIKKRERQKTFILKDSRSILIYELIPYRYFLITILEKVWEKDEQQYFIEPVDTIEVNDYLLHIEFPMDLGTMRKKAEHNQYTTFEQFKKDLYLIISNCLSYNDAGSIWSVAALKLKDFIDSLLEKCEPLAAIYNQQTGLHIMDHID